MSTPVRSVLALKGAPWIGGSVLLVLAVVILYFFTGAAASEPSSVPRIGPGDITSGPSDAPVTLIEYSDFQCPFCAVYAPMLKTLRAKYGDRVQFAYRFFPLSNHPYATIAAQAAYAASRQGRFWEMHDLLFKNQKKWTVPGDPRPSFDAFAKSLGLDMARFHADINAQSTIDVIKRQAAAGEAAGVTHTPWIVIDGKSVLPRSLGEFEKLIEAAL